MIALFDEQRRVRMRAVAEVTSRFAARRVLNTDADAEVRAAAARRLGELAHGDGEGGGEDDVADDVASWLLDALGDRSPLVRDAIVRALAAGGGQAPALHDSVGSAQQPPTRHDSVGSAQQPPTRHDNVGRGLVPRRPLTPGLLPALRALAREDRMWWVRRGALYALGALGGAGELAALEAGLADPFWRVRHAAVRVLAALGARDPEVRDEVIAAPPSGALTYLRAAWGPVAIEAPDRASRAASRLPEALLDPDPAVVTARLVSAEVAPLALVELLCDPHAPLRLLAVERLVASGDREAWEAALDWLEEPRIPHVADTVERMLDGLGEAAGELAARALARPGRDGAARWAIAWIVATRFEALHDAALARARGGGARLRREALALAGDHELLDWARGGDGDVLLDRIASELYERRSDALAALDGAAHPRVRAMQLDAAARRGDWERVEAGARDPHHGPRAIATQWLVRAGRIDGAAAAADEDPAVREAALSATTVAALVDDDDPWVRRAAAERLAALTRGAHALPSGISDAARRALADADPWVRARACLVPAVDDTLLAGVIGCLGDPDEMVRAAALDALAAADDVDRRLRELLRGGTLTDMQRRMAGAWTGDLDAAATVGDCEVPAAEHGGAARSIAASAPATSIDAGAPAVSIDAGAPPPSLERRPFGRAGFDVAPLAVSGAFDLSPASLAIAVDAGVDLMFWEPGYEEMTRFLRTRARRQRVRVVAGSYHAEADAIERDVETALRRLRRDALDVMLLFWSRSAARLDDAAFAMMERLVRAGKVRAIGFSTHQRDLARAAIEANPWDVVMIRHSAAHPGIETELLPAARARGTAVLTFSALCYGRMLGGAPGTRPPSAADCYRYSMSQPGVTACISAPRRRRELVENLAALASPTLPPARLEELRAHGVGVRVENQRFNTLLRQPTRDAAEAAREMLAAEPPPARLPTASLLRPSRSSIGTARRGRDRS